MITLQTERWLNFSLVFSGEAAKCDMNFLSQNPEGVFIFGSLSLGLGSWVVGRSSWLSALGSRLSALSLWESSFSMQPKCF